mgnify:CR=1 FL=1
MRIVAKVDKSVYIAVMNKSTAVSTSDLSARERILRTAHDLFYAEGLRATGIDRVIAEAGVTIAFLAMGRPKRLDALLRARLVALHKL